MTIGYSSPNLPAAAQFQDNGDGTGKFVWQPGEGESGSYVATLTLSDEELSSSAEVTISVGSANKLPVWIDLPGPVSGTTGSAMEFTIRGEDPESGALTIGFGSPNLPAAVQFKDNGDGSGAFTWTPGDGDAGSYTALFTLSDGSLTATSEVALTVTRANQPPVWSLVPEKVAVDAGQAVEFSVTGEDPDGQPLKISYSSADLPQEVEFTDHGDGSATLKWQTEPAGAGSYKADFTITDGALNAAVTVEIEVRAVEAPPAEGGTPPGEETKPPEGGEPTQPE